MAISNLRDHQTLEMKATVPGSIRPDDKSANNWSRIRRDPVAIPPLNGSSTGELHVRFWAANRP